MSATAESLPAPALVDVGQIDRQRYIGGADIAGILGISPWATPVSVWQRKTDPVRPPDSSGKKKLYQRGKAWESVVAEMLIAELEAREHRVTVLSANHRYADAQVPHFAAEIDYEIQLDDIPGVVNVELKTVHPNAAREWGESDTDECPVWYAAQAMWGLGITGRQCCIVAPLFGADEIRIYPIVRDDETIAGMRERAAAFWTHHVLTRTPPEPGSLEDVNRLFKIEAPGKSIVADAAMLEHALRYRSLDAQITALEAQRDEVEFYVKRFMADAESVLIGDKKAFTWKSQKSSRVDTTALKSAYPKLVKEYTRESITRPFKSFSFKPEA